MRTPDQILEQLNASPTGQLVTSEAEVAELADRSPEQFGPGGDLYMARNTERTGPDDNVVLWRDGCRPRFTGVSPEGVETAAPDPLPEPEPAPRAGLTRTECVVQYQSREGLWKDLDQTAAPDAGAARDKAAEMLGDFTTTRRPLRLVERVIAEFVIETLR